MSLGMLNMSVSEHGIFVDPNFRLATFNNWIFDSKPGARCTSQRLADAGFVSAVTADDPYSASCAFCMKTLVWDPEDDPSEEHKSHSKRCLFVETVLGKPFEEITVEETIRLVSFRFARINCEQFQTLFIRGQEFEKNVKEQISKMVKTLR